MRDPEERTRHFVVGEKRKTNLDEPTVRRKVVRTYGAEKDEEHREEARPMFSPRRPLRDDDEDIAVRHVMKKRPIPEYEDDEEDDPGKKAPLLVRVFARGALLAVFFACGYLGANFIFNWADRRGGTRVGDVIVSPSEVKQMEAASPQGETITSGYTIYLPDNGKYTKRGIDITKGTIEADAAKVLSMYVDGLKETNMLDSSAKIANVFISGEIMFLDMNQPFLSSLKKQGAAKASQILSGMTKTAAENFSPVKQIKFFIDGKESKETAPVDLTKPWGKTE